MSTKRCSVCLIDQPLTEYTPDPRNTSDGLRGNCKTCCRKSDRVSKTNKSLGLVLKRGRVFGPELHPDHKLCRRCGTIKPKTEFSSHRGKSGGVASHCLVCNQENYSRWALERMDWLIDYRKNYYWENRDSRLEKAKKWYAKNRERVREGSIAYRLRTRYGMTKEDVSQMYEHQDGRCAICETKLLPLWNGSQENTSPVVDHCHDTGRVRSILCSLHNRGLGGFYDDASRLVRAAVYIEEGANSNRLSLHHLPDTTNRMLSGYRKEYLDNAIRKNNLRQSYDLSSEEVLRMWEEQGGRCLICQEPTNVPGSPWTNPKTPVVDHCHATSNVRGVLDSMCNRALGHFRDDPNILRRAADYLTA